MVRRFILFFILFPICLIHAQSKKSINTGWQFIKGIDTTFSGSLLDEKSELNWEDVLLPHTAHIEPIQKVKQQWQGTCFYRKYFHAPAEHKGKHIALQFDAAMQVADVYLNGKHIFRHTGGYLPFYVDVSEELNYGKVNNILIKLNNEDNPLIPPGKPLKDLDFNYYSGLYRNAWMIIKEKVYITDAIESNQVAGGGVFIHYENVTSDAAHLMVKTEIRNDLSEANDTQVKWSLMNSDGVLVTELISKSNSIKGGESHVFEGSLFVKNPSLWSPESPYLYKLHVEVIQLGKIIDDEIVRTGIRKIRIDPDAFYLNDERVKIRGTNRHQEYPYLGYAISDNAQYRDAWKIKMAGFNFVRSSHYTQSTAFLDACDELGIMVMDAIPGWQFMGNETFQQHSYKDIREMIRRDRNHPSIIMWEASLNESGMSKEYMQKAHAIVHEELPFPHIYSAGWIDEVYDVFLPARQHAKAPDYWKKHHTDRPFLIAEYGDWEYYAQNAGFNQTAYKDLEPEERTSRQLRGFGEKGLLQQALNYQEAHNDNLYGTALGDANWLMFDYNRGYADEIESSGIMDIMRLPKFAFYFYQSQVDPVITNGNDFNKPMIFIASYWQPGSATDVRIFSNCEEVELFVNGKSLGRQKPDQDKYSTHLKHPPFTFKISSFQAGTLLAVGYYKGKKVAEQKRSTPGTPSKIHLRVDYSNKKLETGKNDVVLVYADILDNHDQLVPDVNSKIIFTVTGGEIVGEKAVNAEAGIAAILLKAGSEPSKIVISAEGEGLKTNQLSIE